MMAEEGEGLMHRVIRDRVKGLKGRSYSFCGIRLSIGIEGSRMEVKDRKRGKAKSLGTGKR